MLTKQRNPRRPFLVFCLCLLTALFASPSFATVIVTSPTNGATVATSAIYTASATATTCDRGVAAMGIYVDNALVYTTQSKTLSTAITLGPGSHYTFVQEWDYCGGSTGTPVTVSTDATSAVHVTAPAAGNVSTTPTFVASATSSCAWGVASTGVYVDDQLVSVQNGSNLNQQLSLTPGSHNAVVQAWDNCGGATKQAVPLSVQAPSLTQIQAVGNWNQWGEFAPEYAICAPCDGITWNMTQNQSAISLSGNATKFEIGGTSPYADVLWSNKLIGQGTTENMPDTKQTLLPSIHNMTYDADVYVTNLSITQSLEFDVNLYMYGVGMEWGTECNYIGDGDWDIWDNVNAKWVSTGAPCKLVNKAWNHVTVQAQRLADNSLLYVSVSLNGVTYPLNIKVPPFTVPSGWYGMTVNYQMDGNYQMADNTTYLDNLTVSYW